MKNIIIIGLLLVGISSVNAQFQPSPKQTKSVLITNATAHLGNGQIIENSLIGFRNGKLDLVVDATVSKIDMSKYDIKINATGKHVYPGFIAPNSTLGLVEIDAVKASSDEDEIGSFIPNVRSLAAYNAESIISQTVVSNGILMAQITPRGGRISGTSSVVQLNAWNWKEAVIKENDGIHLNFPSNFKKGRRAENGVIEVNKDYNDEIQKIREYFTNAKAYNLDSSKERNLVLEANKGLFDGSQKLYVHADEEKQIIDAIALFESLGMKNLVLVGGYEAYKIGEILAEKKIPVLLKRVHDMPVLDEDPTDLPFKLANELVKKGVLVGLENSGDMERMNTRNLPFLAGTCAAYGLDKEVALQLITSNTAKILGIDSFCGTLESGKDATLFISEGDALDMRTNKLQETFIQGRLIDLKNHQSELNVIYKKKYGLE
jgi:imidazolonepropionase-like amidohydrolase